MLHKILTYWGVALLLIPFSQCSQCKNQPIENISQWKLTWEEAKPFNNSLPNINLTDGITCHIPSEQATYCLDPTGECWRFTQDAAVGLTYEKIASFSGITGQQTFFAFPAGPTQEQTLYVGILDQQQITLIHYKNGIWEPVESCKLNVEALKTCARGASCSIHEGDNQLNGLIVLKPQAKGQPLITLVYDAAKKTLAYTDKWKLQSTMTPNIATEIAPGIVLLGRRQFKNSVFYLSKGDTSKDDRVFTASAEPERLSLFVLTARKLMKKAVLVLHTEKNLDFYTLEVGSERMYMQASEHLPEKLEETDKEEEKRGDKRIDHSESLVIHFSDAVYVVTKDKDDAHVYYRGSIQAPRK